MYFLGTEYSILERRGRLVRHRKLTRGVVYETYRTQRIIRVVTSIHKQPPISRGEVIHMTELFSAVV